MVAFRFYKSLSRSDVKVLHSHGRFYQRVRSGARFIRHRWKRRARSEQIHRVCGRILWFECFAVARRRKSGSSSGSITNIIGIEQCTPPPVVETLKNETSNSFVVFDDDFNNNFLPREGKGKEQKRTTTRKKKQDFVLVVVVVVFIFFLSIVLSSSSRSRRKNTEVRKRYHMKILIRSVCCLLFYSFCFEDFS